MIRLLALDLDGTLLTDNKTISEKNKATLKKAQAKGCKVVITTGRPLGAIAPFIKALELGKEDYAITFNGGLIQNVVTGEILGKQDLKPADLQKVYDAFKKINLPLSVLSEEKVYDLPTSLDHPSIYQELNPLLTYEKANLADLPSNRIYNKFVSAIDATYLDAKIPEIPSEITTAFEVMKSRTCLLEVLPKGVSKAFGLKVLGDYLNISAKEMMSFGDEENDLSMIKSAGIGVVMANGNPKVKEYADFITKSNEEDGVAYAIEKFVLKEEN